MCRRGIVVGHTFAYGQGNGFPSGFHYSLLIHGKDASFSCPQPMLQVTADNNGDFDLGQLVSVCDVGDECVQVFGNVINVPRVKGTDPVSILIESGIKGPKGATATTELEVTDWCTESFPDNGSAAPPLGDSAVMRLPKNTDGYAVYARVLGKPGEDGGPTFNMVPSLQLVEDEAGNDLLLLGFVTPLGVFNPDGLPVSRYDPTRSGKGAKNATNISALFNWTGSVCYINGDPSSSGIQTDLTARSLCCVETEGVYSSCELLTESGELIDGSLQCPAGTVLIQDALCAEYSNKWVFNIADFVNVLWDVTPDGAYNVQIRFYPLPLK